MAHQAFCVTAAAAATCVPLAFVHAQGQLNWTQMDNASPTPRYRHAAAYDSDRHVMVVFGGESGETDTWEWNTNTRTWRLAAPRGTGPSRRAGHAMVFDSARHRTVLVGGSYNGTTFSDVWEWDGINWTERTSAPLPDARSGHAMVYDNLRSRTVLYAGNSTSANATKTLEYDGSAWTAITTPQNPGALGGGPAAAYDSSHARMVMVVGGSPWPTAPATIWEYVSDAASPSGRNWVQQAYTGAVPNSRTLMKLAYDSQRSQVLWHGGLLRIDSNTFQGVGSFWSLENLNWVARGSSPVRKLQHSFVYDSDHQETLDFGGNANTCACGVSGIMQVWDGTAWNERWRRGSIAPIYLPQAAFDTARGVLVSYGGLQVNPADFSNVPPLSDTRIWDGSTWTYLTTANNPGDRYRGQLVYDPIHQISILFGGTTDDGLARGDGGASTASAQVWVFDGVDWTRRADSPAGQRFRFGAAFDSARGRMIVFGGTNQANTDVGDTWEYNPADDTWVQAATAGPGARHWASMAYDAAAGRTILFGGATTATALDDTWAWNGTAWSVVPVTGGIRPPARKQAGLAYAPHQGRMVLYAGVASETGTAGRDDVWVLTGNTWTQQPGTAPPDAKVSMAFVYDPGHKVFIVHGGGFTTNVDHTNGQTWYARFPEHCQADFNSDGDFGTDQDIEAFFACLGGHCCATCGVSDFNGDGDSGTDQDIESFFRVLGGGPC